jgi:hypothetical protein
MTATSVGQLPLGVAIIAVLVGIFGFFVLLAGIILLVVGIGIGLSVSIFGFTGAIAGLIFLLIGAIILAIATGLWDQELWALVLAIIVLLFYGAVEFFSAAWLGFIIVVLLLIYLVAVSSHFD